MPRTVRAVLEYQAKETPLALVFGQRLRLVWPGGTSVDAGWTG